MNSERIPTTAVIARGRRSFAVLAAATALCLAASVASAAVASEAERTWQRVEPLLHFHNPGQVLTEGPCAKTIDTPDGPIRSCAGLIDSFDGLSLSVGIRMPEDATAPLPTLLYLHGFPSNRGEFVSSASGWPADFNGTSFAGRGYLMVMPSARGMGGSCGLLPQTGPHAEELPPLPQPETPHGPTQRGMPVENFMCSGGHSHIADRDWEIRDYQHLLGLLVDAGVAAPNRLGVLGASYGGGQAWQLATALPWRTPSGGQTINLAAAVPVSGWTSMQNSATPNGRATDERGGGRSLERPFGVFKESGGIALFAGARSPIGSARYNDADPTETHSFITGWLAVYERGEPYDTPAARALAAALRNKSAYFADEYFSALRTGDAEPVPVLAVQGWNDASFGAVEALQMYRKLKAADPGYPISIFLGNVGHATFGPTKPAVAAWQALAVEFLAAHLLQRGSGADEIVSMSTECSAVALDDPVPTSQTVVAGDWDAIHPGLLTLRSDRPLTTLSGLPNHAEELRTDPALPRWTRPDFTGCIRQPFGTYENRSDYRWPVPSGGLTLLGLPTLIAGYRLTGVDATVVAKLWDVDPAGNRTLVTRGVYRLSLAGGDDPSGGLRFQLFGNHYRFADGHSIELEISQTDQPYLRPNNLPSTIDYDDIKLELPTVEQLGRNDRGGDNERDNDHDGHDDRDNGDDGQNGDDRRGR